MFSDKFVIVGIALIVFSLGLMFAWTFIWLIGGAIVNLIRGVSDLGGKWCYKEVSVK